MVDADKFAIFEPIQAQYIRLDAYAATMNKDFVSVKNISVWSTDVLTTEERGLGRWGATIDFPLVPVGVFIDPLSGRVISFSSYQHDNFGQDNSNRTTLTSTWEPNTYMVSQRGVRHIDHDMFCPGMSFDVGGRMIITGGATAHRSSIYDPEKDDWKKAADLQIARGYQGSITSADGRIFVIGGSWAPDNPRQAGGRNGEIYDPKTDQTTLLKGCPAKPIETDDWEGSLRADNHVWLMGWKNNSIFHAGPAKSMHWISIAGQGFMTEAGLRGADNDAMCGVAAMYDAARGKILTAGGSPNYRFRDDKDNIRGRPASNNSFIITLGEFNEPVDVQVAGNGMKHQRIFHHAVILPNGDVFVVGGQIEGQAFTENNPQLQPEIYSPPKNTWTVAANHSTIRVYHSFGLLLADATILVGGGGLCSCEVNHFDAQIYIPEYLLTPDGARAEQPIIETVSASSVLPGASISINTNRAVTAASLVRFGGATHSLNNDQRRIELVLEQVGTGSQYVTSIPTDGGIATPGYWMLFVIDAAGVPSKAKTVQVLVEEKY